jgi:uncharacterized glyoxalase superfamily protein PhnB
MTPNIFPVLRYTDARASIDWLVRVFGFDTVVCYDGPDGTVAHAEIRCGVGIVGISSAGPPQEDNPWSYVRSGVYVRVDDPDAHHDRAKAAGAEIVMPLRDMHYGSRDYSARDIDGHLWGFGTYSMGAGEGEPNIYPELAYRTPEATEWLANAFGFRPTAEITGPDGKVFHAEMRLGDGAIMMGIRPSGELYEAISVRIDDPDAHHEQAAAAGATITQKPMTTPYGARAYWVTDPEGFLWIFSTYRAAE